MDRDVAEPDTLVGNKLLFKWFYPNPFSHIEGMIVDFVALNITKKNQFFDNVSELH